MIRRHIHFCEYVGCAGCIGVCGVGAVPSAWGVQRVFGGIEVIRGTLMIWYEPMIWLSGMEKISIPCDAA